VPSSISDRASLCSVPIFHGRDIDFLWPRTRTSSCSRSASSSSQPCRGAQLPSARPALAMAAESLCAQFPARPGWSRRRSRLSPFAFVEAPWLDSAQFASYSPLCRARSVPLFLRVLPRSSLFSFLPSRCRARKTARSRHRVRNARARHGEMMRVFVSEPSWRPACFAHPRRLLAGAPTRQPLLSYLRQHTTMVVFIEFANTLLLIRLSSLVIASRVVEPIVLPV
jgi:hypothetical protein